MFWKVGFIVAILTLVASNLVWFYKVLDMSVSINYQRDSMASCSENVKKIKTIIPHIVNIKDKKQFIKLLETLYPDPYVVLDKEDIVSIGDLGFVIDGTKIVEIKSY